MIFSLDSVCIGLSHNTKTKCLFPWKVDDRRNAVVSSYVFASLSHFKQRPPSKEQKTIGKLVRLLNIHDISITTTRFVPN